MSIDLNDPNVQAAIAAAVQQQLAAAGVQQPEPVKELSPEEKAQAAIDAVAASLARDGNRVVDHLSSIVDALKALLAAHVAAKDASVSAAPATVSDASTTEASQ